MKDFNQEELFPIGCIVEANVMEKLPQYEWKPVAVLILPISDNMPENESKQSASVGKTPIGQMRSHSFGAELYAESEEKPLFFQRTY